MTTLTPDSPAVRLFNATIPKCRLEDMAAVLNDHRELRDLWNAVAAEHERLCASRIAAAEKSARVWSLQFAEAEAERYASHYPAAAMVATRS
jgi:hypothetical protein